MIEIVQKPLNFTWFLQNLKLLRQIRSKAKQEVQ